MKCHKIKRLLPLYLEKDLPKKKASRIKSHLEECPLCQKEYKKYKGSLSQTKKWIQSKTLKWKEKEWRNTLDTAFHPKKQKNNIFVPLSFKQAWAAALMLVLAAALSFFVAHPSLMKKERSDVMASDIKLRDSQKQVEFTFVSLEKDLKIKWIFNKDFKLEENKK